MGPLIIFFWFFLIPINMMVKGFIISSLESIPLIMDSGSAYLIVEFQMNKGVCKRLLSSSQIIRIHKKHLHIVLHNPLSYNKGYNTGQSNEICYTDVYKYIVFTNCKSNNFSFKFSGETIFYGKVPPNVSCTKVNFSGLTVSSDNVG